MAKAIALTMLVSALPVNMVSAEESYGSWGTFGRSSTNWKTGVGEGDYYMDYSTTYGTATREDLKEHENGYAFSTDLQSTDANWSAWLATFPDGDRFHMVPAGRAFDCSDIGIGISFTTSQDANWVVECDVVNVGKGADFGTGNEARITTLAPGETLETKYNSVDFPVRNNNDVTGSGGYYRSPIKKLKSGSVIAMTVSTGIDSWGDNIYPMLKIYRVSDEGKILQVYDFTKYGSANEVVNVNNDDATFTSTIVEGTDKEFTATPEFGPWSFYVEAPFYQAANWEDRTKDEFRTEEELTTYVAFNAGVADARIVYPGTDLGTNIYNNKAGIVIKSDDSGSSNDNNWHSTLELYPAYNTSTVRFIPSPRNSGCAYSGIAVKFTVPVDGIYDVLTTVKNYGWLGGNGLKGYGDQNLARVSVLTGDTKVQTEDNTATFGVGRPDWPEPSYQSGKQFLNAGDSVWLEVYTGDNGNFDDFFASQIIKRYDDQDNLLETYDLGKSTFTRQQKWNLFHANKSATNSSDFIYMPAATSGMLIDNLGFENYAGVVTSYWGKPEGRVNMSAEAPNFGWDYADDYMTINTQDQDMLISYDIDKDGTYNLTEKAMLEGTTSSNVSVGIYNGEELLDSFTIGTTASENTCVASLSAGDRVYFRITKDTDDVVDTIKFNPSVTEYFEKTEYFVGQAKVSSTDELNPEDVLTVKKNLKAYDENTKVFVVLYDLEGGKTLSSVAMADQNSDFTASITLPSDYTQAKYQIKTMVWNMTKMSVLDDAVIFE